MKKLRRLAVVVIALLIYFLLPHDALPAPADGDSGQHNSESSAVVDYGSLYDVVRIVDGDTIVVDVDGEQVKVRLIGVNTPESVHSDASKNVPEGKDASAYTENLLGGRKVYLVYDEDREDNYGRTLAYVYTEEYEFVNLLLVEEGLAECMRVAPNVRFASVFAEAESAAKAADKGFWSQGEFPD